MAPRDWLPILVAMVQLSESLASWSGLVEDLDLLAVAIIALTARAIFETASELSLLQWRTLAELESAGPLRLSDLAARLPSSMPASSRLVKRMTERGLLATRPAPADGRGISVQLSAKGRTLRSAVINRRRDLMADAIGSSSLPNGLHDGLAILGERLRTRSLVFTDA
jgi:DNA-binding MarR family transcriptional regulator